MGEDYSRVTTFSRVLALILFVTLPFVAFYLGVEYEKLSQQAEKGGVIFEQTKCAPCQIPQAE